MDNGRTIGVPVEPALISPSSFPGQVEPLGLGAGWQIGRRQVKARTANTEANLATKPLHVTAANYGKPGGI